MRSDHFVILCTVPDEQTAATIATALVAEKLAACCNIIPGVRSIYKWKGALCDDREFLLIVKTRANMFDNLSQRLRALHPYEVPEILALPVQRGLEDYLNWVDVNVNENTG